MLRWIMAGFVLLVALGLGFLFVPVAGVRVADAEIYAPAAMTSIPQRPCIQPLSAGSINDLRPLFTAFEAAEKSASVQIARMLLCDENTPAHGREVREFWLTKQLETRLRREELMAIDLNLAYYGASQRGAMSASQSYFGKAPRDLDVAQAALLVGLMQRPNYFDPRKHPDRALERRNQVLDAMRASGSLTAAQSEAAKELPLELHAN